jgi:hypothetical protein
MQLQNKNLFRSNSIIFILICMIRHNDNKAATYAMLLFGTRSCVTPET